MDHPIDAETHETRVAPCPAGGERRLTPGEVALAQSVFGTAIDYRKVTIRRRKWAFFQPKNTTMAPRGHLHFHPDAAGYCDDFSAGNHHSQGHFIHEMTHVWQTQTRGEWYLPLHRHPWCRYDYSIKPGWGLAKYGIEQQAEIVKHAFWLRNGVRVAGIASRETYDLLVRFPGGKALTDYEFIFALYALLLGLSLVEILSGLGRTLELRFASDAGGERFSIGWLTPLLAVFVILDLLSFWMFSWTVRDVMAVNPATLLAVVGFASAYYLAARLVFPGDPERFRDLDTHYFRVCRTVMGMLIALVVVQWAFLLSLPQLRENLLSPMVIWVTALFVGLMGTLIFVRNRQVHAVVLVALIIRYLVILSAMT